MNSDTVLTVNNVSKKFCRNLKRSMAYGILDLSKNLFGIKQDSSALRKDEFWALNDVSFDLKRGDALALIGKNGSGKSTLLRVINGIFPPDKGTVQFRGRMSALIALGAGFHPHMTGRENIYLNAAILGMKKSEIHKKVDEIIAFAEIEEFIDSPVSSYSSGMRVRLGFSIAIQCDPDILVIDEVLAVGDIGFKSKSYNAITKIIDRAAVVFVSHSMSHVGRLCNRGLLLERGRVQMISDNIIEVIDAYIEKFDYEGPEIVSTGKDRLLGIAMRNSDHLSPDPFPEEIGTAKSPIIAIEFGKPVVIALKVDLDPSIEFFSITYSILDLQQNLIAQCFSATEAVCFENPNKPMTIKTTIHPFNLKRGRYSLKVQLVENPGREHASKNIAIYKQIVQFQICSDPYLGPASVQLDGKWTVEPEKKS